MKKILVIGDPHIRIINTDIVNKFLIELKKTLDEEKVDLIICLGDILHNHERIHSTALNKAMEFINLLRSYCKTYLIVGNHDYINNQQFLSDKHWLTCLKDLENIKIVDNVIKIEEMEEEMICVPYVPNGRFIEALNTYEDWKDCDIIFAHQELSGVKMGCIISECEDWKEEYPMVISGHIHSNQWIGENLYYPGSAFQNAYGESKFNIISILDIKEDDIDIREINLKLPRKKIIYNDISNINKDCKKIINKLEEEYRLGNKIRMVIKDDKLKIKLFLKSKEYKLIKDKCNLILKINNIVLTEEEEEKNEIKDIKKILKNHINKIEEIEKCKELRKIFLKYFC